MNSRSQFNPRKPSYPLSLVKELVNSSSFAITHNAIRQAETDFGWKRGEIVRAFQRLKGGDFYKTEQKYDGPPGVMVDYYKARSLMGEQVYTHFRVESGDSGEKLLVICSFKRI